MSAEHAVKEKETLKVKVTYVAAKKPFEQPDAPRTETVAILKAAAMEAFGVKEAQDAEKQVRFWLYQGSTKLEQENRTLGDLVGDEKKLELRLVQQIIYGCNV